MIRRVLLVVMVSVLFGCQVRFEGDHPSSAFVDGRWYVASGARGYAFEATDLKPYETAERSTVGGANGSAVFELSGVDPREALVLPALPGQESEHFLLIRQDILVDRKGQPDLGVPGLCRYRVTSGEVCF